MINKNIKNALIYILAIGAGVFALFFVITSVWIGYEVKNNCYQAEKQYGQDCVISLMALAADEKQTFRARNDAVWALGQLGDRRALPVLTELYTGDIPSREPYDKMLSQYELKKAVNLAGGGTNITAIFWRYGID